MTQLFRAWCALLMLSLLAACGGGGGSSGSAGSGAKLFTTAGDKVLILPGNTQVYSIGGGVPNYSATSGSANLQVSVTGTTLTMTAVGSGTATVTVKDAAGSSVQIEVTLGTGLDLYSTAPANLTIPVGGVSDVFSVGGGSNVYNITSSNPGVVSVGRNGWTFVLSGNAAGSATVSITDSLGKSVSITVTVGSNLTLYSTAPSSVTMPIGNANTYTIGGGAAPYTAGSSDPSVATVSVQGNQLIIAGVATGTAIISLRDAIGGTVTINATVGSGTAVGLFTNAPSSIVVATSARPSFGIGGGKAPYSVASSNPAVVGATVAGANLSLVGLTVGTAQVIVTDADGKTVKIDVTVGTGQQAKLFTTAPAGITLISGSSMSFDIGGGSAPYKISSSNVSVASVTSNATGFTVNGVGAGSAQVVVTDATGATVAVGVTVTTVTTAPLDVLPGNASGNVGDTLTFNVAGGSPGYTISINNPSIATIAPTTLSGAGSFTARLLNAGVTSITVTDAANNSKTITLTVAQANTLLRLSPSAITVGENSTNNVVLSIYGGTPPYTGYTSDLNLSSVTVSGSTFTVGLGTKGNRCVAPVTAFDTIDIILTVVDSLGASATTTMSIKDNGGAACP